MLMKLHCCTSAATLREDYSRRLQTLKMYDLDSTPRAPSKHRRSTAGASLENHSSIIQAPLEHHLSIIAGLLYGVHSSLKQRFDGLIELPDHLQLQARCQLAGNKRDMAIMPGRANNEGTDLRNEDRKSQHSA